MKVGELYELLNAYDNDDEIEIEIYETATERYIDTTAAVAFSDGVIVFVPTLKIDVKAEKFRDLIS